MQTKVIATQDSKSDLRLPRLVKNPITESIYIVMKDENVYLLVKDAPSEHSYKVGDRLNFAQVNDCVPFYGKVEIDNA